MATTELQGDGRLPNKPGVYEHPETGIRLTTSNGTDGFIQGDAFVQVGFKYIGTVEEVEEKSKTTK